MPGLPATKKHGGAASPAAASPAGKAKDADLSGMPTDAGLLTDIMGELGERPEPAESETDEPEAESEEPAAEEDSGTEEAEGENDETPEGESDEPGEAEAATDAEEGAEGEEPAAEGEEEDGAEGEEPAKPAKGKEDKTALGLRRELYRLREELRQLKASGAPAPRPLVQSEQEIMAADTPERLVELEEHFQQLEDLALANRDGYEVPAAKEGDEPKVYSREQMGQILTNARRALRAIPKRREELQREEQGNRVAAQIYRGYEDPDSDESRGLAYLLKIVPEIRRLPNYRVVLGDAIAGERARVAKAKAAAAAAKGKDGKAMPGKPAAAKRKVPAAVPGAPHRAPSAPAPKAQKLAAARKRAEASGSEASLADLIEAGLG